MFRSNVIFSFVENLYVFFTASPHRVELLSKALHDNEMKMTLKKISVTRWSSRFDAVRALKNDYKAVKSVLENFMDNTGEKSAAINEAKGLFTNMCDLEIGIYLEFWYDLLNRTNSTKKSLQKASLDLNTAVAALRSLKQYVESLREKFSEYEEKGRMLSEVHQYRSEKRRKRRRNVRLNPLDYGQSEESTFSSSEKFRVESFINVVDEFVTSLNQRLVAYEETSEKFSVFRCDSSSDVTTIQNAAKQLVNQFSDDLDLSFPSECIQS